jgi:hypothetical protein
LIGDKYMSAKQINFSDGAHSSTTPIMKGTKVIISEIPEIFNPKEKCTVTGLDLLLFFVINKRGVGCWFQRGDRRIEVIK